MRLIPTVLLLLVSPCLVNAAWGQQGAATGSPLVVRTTTLPKAFLRRPFRFQLYAEGGITPLKWQLTDGTLPAGLDVTPDGFITGNPAATGEFRFTVTVTDSGRPAVQRAQALTLLVATPLVVEWGRYPRVNGQKVEGSIKISDNTDWDFDLTVIVVAVDDTGRATSLGYRRMKLGQSSGEVEIPFGQNLPLGTYEVNVDAVGEVASANAIYRARLVTKERLQVKQGP